ncbi:flavin-containing monooxygenase [Halotalea alkalilenta]|uniref:Cyclohexanone monooxygenase n=1 Tax=Halotalea alkalilenta TaxID=376489 RepID=A0A172YF37_9GAMM|nr:NAD(P)/FAD-dependent oxidoreductase [Halotalea alkalilenta]ANF57834.1 cyclohexanone monooxygenase [Halotalea alkalilenta]
MSDEKHVDAIVVGAGFSGLYMLKKLRDELGLDVVLFDKAGDVGGTWYWNRYPGALSDTEAYLYVYSWDKELLQDHAITHHYANQPTIIGYLKNVAARHDLRKNIVFNTGISSAIYDEKNGLWHVTTDKDDDYTCRHFVTALGLLSASNVPNIEGRETFKGQSYHSAQWPEGVNLEGKKVGVIGTGSTGTQIITAIAPVVGALTVFQRSAQYTVPAGNGPVAEEYEKAIKENYDEIWEGVWNSSLGFGLNETSRSLHDVSEEERDAIFQQAWKKGGGFRFMFETFGDIATDEVANKYAQDFIRRKIREIVKDPVTAEKLCPKDLYAKRPICDSGYYSVYNQDNVSLVDVKANPIKRITPNGILTEDGVEHALDVIIFATGFDAVDGNYTKFEVRGRGGKDLKEHWKEGPSSYLGMFNNGYPNMYMVLGPNGPFSNLPPAIELEVRFISDLIKHAEEQGFATVEATGKAVSTWSDACDEIAHMTLFPKAESWIFGANIPGKKNQVYFYMGGIKAFKEALERTKLNGYEGLTLTYANVEKAGTA